MIGGVIMVHGDDHGLRLPPAIAPHQVVVIQLDEESEVAEAAERIVAELRAAGVRTHVDARFHISFGRRSVDWELKGVPVRIELGARELASGQATLVRRDDRSKSSVPLDGAARAAAGLLDEIQQVLFAESRTFREEHTYPVTDFDEFKRARRRRRAVPGCLVRHRGVGAGPRRGHQRHDPLHRRRRPARTHLPDHRHARQAHRPDRPGLLTCAMVSGCARPRRSGGTGTRWCRRSGAGRRPAAAGPARRGTRRSRRRRRASRTGRSAVPLIHSSTGSGPVSRCR